MDQKKNPTAKNPADEKFPGYPQYPANEDIYSQDKKEQLEDGSEEPKLKKEARKDHLHGIDLEVPGAELDDQDEAIGEEDEENNYYSLGGDNHEDLEEDPSGS